MQLKLTGYFFMAHLRLGDMTPGGDVVCQPDISAYRGAMSDSDTPEDGRSRIDHDIVFDDRMTLISLDQGTLFIYRETFGA